MAKPSDLTIQSVQLYFLEVETRVPYKFGEQILERVVCARARVEVRLANGVEAEGWGETPLSVGWVWPTAELGYDRREERLKAFCERLAVELSRFQLSGHPLEVGYAFQREKLKELLASEGREFPEEEPMPYLAGLVCLSAFDLAMYDGFGVANGVGVFESFTSEFMSADLSVYLEADDDGGAVEFVGRFPDEFLAERLDLVPVWHSVGGADPLEEAELTGDEPDDGYPVLLREWIRRDGLKCLKIKLPGTDEAWDYQRLVAIGRVVREEGIEHLCVDFNCMVEEVGYVNRVLDRLKIEDEETFRKILYVEQPFPYDLEATLMDVHEVSERCRLLMDESAHDWCYVRLGRQLGWTGVALKTCKTLTGAMLTLCWARAHGMDLMVQDLTNPMLAQVSHVLLAAYAGTLMGCESNSMQYYPEASLPEAAVHEGLYRRRDGVLDLRTLGRCGFGYRLDEMVRELPPPAVA